MTAGPDVTAVLPDFFGSDEQQAVLRRGQAMHQITRNISHCAYYGRTVGIVSPSDAPLETVTALAQLQGNSNFAMVPNGDIAPLSEQAKASGFIPTIYARWVGSEESLTTSRDIIANRPLPDGLTLDWLGPDTPAPTRQALANCALSCNVLPPALSVLSGQVQPGVCALARDGSGDVIACAAAAAFFHQEHAMGGVECWWGMLATRADHRGRSLALILGAAAMCRMHDLYRFTRFFTGVEPGNGPSEAVCSRMGLGRTGLSTLGLTDPGLLPCGRMTK